MVWKNQKIGDPVLQGVLSIWSVTALFLIVMMLSGLFIVPSAGAANFTVNSTEDLPDLDPGNGLCVAYIVLVPPFYVFPFCTLRAAIQETNALAGGDVVQLSSNEYLLTQTGTGEDEGVTGDLDITGPLSIIGSGVGQTVINGNGLDRVFDVHADASSVLFTNLTITEGRAAAEESADSNGGGGVRNRGGLRLSGVSLLGNSSQALGAEQGGGLYNQGNCTVEQATISGNIARLGGGIYNDAGGTLTVQASTIDQNRGNEGGGLYSQGAADLINVTVSGNRAATGFGGGMWNQGNMRLLQATVTDNVAAAGAAVANIGRIALSNTIVAQNSDGQCHGQALLSSGGNLVGDAGCLGASRLVSDLVGVDPRLGILADNGGPTRTHAISYASPAVNQGLDQSSMSIVTDQRGMGRPLGGRYDIGAFEAAVPVLPFISPLLISR